MTVTEKNQLNQIIHRTMNHNEWVKIQQKRMTNLCRKKGIFWIELGLLGPLQNLYFILILLKIVKLLYILIFFNVI